ncbi:MAG: nucleotide exchange factor GrpE [Candidatus Bathyarchaeia archaeon]
MSEEPKPSQQPEEEKKKLEELAQALEEEKRRSEDYLNRLKYAQADLENLKKRAARELEEAKKYCNENLVVSLLEVVDELEMALKSQCTSETAEALAKGVEMTLKKLKKILEKEQVYPIECIGKPFDPAKHEAVARVEDENSEGCKVIEEVRKGYIMKGKVIRPSIVKVSVNPLSEPKKEVDPNEQR